MSEAGKRPEITHSQSQATRITDQMATIATQRDEIDRLQTALAVYGRHHRGCPVIVLRDSGSSCACGFRAALVPEAPR